MTKEKVDLKQLLSHSLSEIKTDKKLKTDLLRWYSYLYDVKVCASCDNKIQGYYDSLKLNGINRFNMEDSKFKMREDVGAKQMEFGGSEFISNDNITDEKAIKFLKGNPNRISLFEKFPANYKEMLEDKPKTEKAGEEKEVKNPSTRKKTTRKRTTSKKKNNAKK